MSDKLEHSLIIKMYRLLSVCANQKNAAIYYFENIGGFTDDERNLLCELLKEDFQKLYDTWGLADL